MSPYWFLILPLSSIGLTILLGDSLTPLQRLFFATVPLIITLKLYLLLSRKVIGKLSASALLAYLFFWPGMDWKPFTKKTSSPVFSSKRFRLGALCFCFGIALLVFCSANVNFFSPLILSWVAVLALFITVHFGFAEILGEGVHFFGWNVTPLFRDPLYSLSLAEFWGRRWNLAFVEMNQLIFLPIFRKRFSPRTATFLIFIISALLHEYALSFPAGGGWGGPSLYFLLHGILTVFEKHCFPLFSWPDWLRRLWTFGWLILPLPLLFHSKVRSIFVLPLLEFMHEVIW